MPHVLSMFDSEFLHCYDLTKDQVEVEIESVAVGELTAQGGRKSKKPVVKFKGAEKKLALNKTNAKAIIALYGPNTEDWPGKKVVLFKSRTQMGGEEVDCIRVRGVK